MKQLIVEKLKQIHKKMDGVMYMYTHQGITSEDIEEDKILKEALEDFKERRG